MDKIVGIAVWVSYLKNKVLNGEASQTAGRGPRPRHLHLNNDFALSVHDEFRTESLKLTVLRERDSKPVTMFRIGLQRGNSLVNLIRLRPVNFDGAVLKTSIMCFSEKFQVFQTSAV